MVKFKVGDSVIVTNVAGIMYGDSYFKDNEVTTVARVEEDGSQTYGIDLYAPNASNPDKRDNINGIPSLYIMSEEFVNIAKLLPDNKGGS